MSLATFRRRLTLIVMSMLLLTISLSLVMSPQTVFAQSATRQLNPARNSHQTSADAQSATITVTSNVVWKDTGIALSVGNALTISATGSWSADPGDGFTGPDGYTKKVADNFLNLTDIGVCASCATTPTSFWGGLIAYIGPLSVFLTVGYNVRYK